MDPIRKLQDYIFFWMPEKETIKVLEAGCGSTSLLSFSPRTLLFGIALSEHQLWHNDTLRQKVRKY